MRMHNLTPAHSGRRLSGFLFLLLLIALVPDALQAQRRAQRFKAGLIAGLTASQIDGDQSAGYHKVGVQGGLRAIAMIKDKQDVSVELLFTQRGCRNQPRAYSEVFNITLNYVEVPFQWHFHDWPASQNSDKPDYYRVHLNAGLSYARLLDYKDKFGFNVLSPVLPKLNRNSFCFLIGASLYVSKHLALTVRYHRAANKLYKPDPNIINDLSLNEHFLAFQTMYVF